MSIRNISWAVPPQSSKLNRPTRLLRELTTLGAVDVAATHWFHGRAQAVEGTVRTSSLNPGRSLSGSGTFAIMSPLFLWGHKVKVAWTDLYDDWSIAPDINPIHRYVAGAGYRRLRSTESENFGLVTVNSPYMARKIGLTKSLIVPNGVDEYIGRLPHSGDDRVRLVILGHFFKGRTDFELIKRVAMLRGIDEIVVGGMGRDAGVLRLFKQLQNESSSRFTFIDWIDTHHLTSIVGMRTIALVPNLVNDYTLSQDLMKAYTFMSLGIPTICPAPLWPAGISKDYVFLTGHGDSLEGNFRDWLESERPSDVWREQFAMSNSWKMRARSIAERIGQSHEN